MWDLETQQCNQTLSGHSEVVTSLLCWDQYLISCSLDKTIKVWACTNQGSVEVTYTHHEKRVSFLSSVEYIRNRVNCEKLPLCIGHVWKTTLRLKVTNKIHYL